MHFRQRGSDARRRRVLIEELCREASAETKSRPKTRRKTSRASAPSERRSYSDAALAEHQPKITDQIPHRGMRLAKWAAYGAAATLAVQGLDWIWRCWPQDARPPELSVWDASQRGGAACWLASLFLLLAYWQTRLIYRLRRHKTDDYQGRYRLWAVAATVSLAAAAEVACGCFSGPLKYIAASSQSLQSLSHPAWLLLPAGFFWTSAVSRLAYEMRSCRLALLLLAGASGCGVIAWLGGEQHANEFVQTAKHAGAFPGACLLAWLTVGAYARHVYRDSQGMLAEKKAERETSASPDPEPETQTAKPKASRKKAVPASRRSPRKKKAVVIAPPEPEESYEEEILEPPASQEVEKPAEELWESEEVEDSSQEEIPEEREAETEEAPEESPPEAYSEYAEEQPEDPAEEEPSPSVVEETESDEPLESESYEQGEDGGDDPESRRLSRAARKKRKKNRRNQKRRAA